MKTLFTFLIFLCIASFTSAQGTWTQLPDFPGGARYGATSLVANGKVYVGLGFDGTYYHGDWWEYDPTSGIWTRKANFPGYMEFASSLVINGKCYVGVGLWYTDGTFVFTRYWFEYDPDSDQWFQKADFPDDHGQGGRYGTSTFAIDSIGYICSGNEYGAQGPYTHELWSYNSTKDKWVKKAHLPTKSRYLGIGFSINGKGYVQGGLRVNQQDKYKYFDDLWEYNPGSDSWTEKASSPAGGEAAEACFIIDSKAYIGLGERQLNFNKTFYSYDPVTDTWQDSIAQFPADGRECACGFSIDGIGYVMLGYNPNKQGYYGDVWQYTPPSLPGNSETKQTTETTQKPFVQYTLIGNNLIPSFNLTQKSATFYFRLYDLNGRLIQSQTIGESAIIYLDAALPKGIYLIVTSGGTKNSTQKILIQ